MLGSAPPAAATAEAEPPPPPFGRGRSRLERYSHRRRRSGVDVHVDSSEAAEAREMVRQRRASRDAGEAARCWCCTDPWPQPGSGHSPRTDAATDGRRLRESQAAAASTMAMTAANSITFLIPIPPRGSRSNVLPITLCFSPTRPYPLSPTPRPRSPQAGARSGPTLLFTLT